MTAATITWVLALAGVLATAQGFPNCASVGYTTKWIFFIQCYGITKDNMYELTAVLTRIKIKFPTYVINVDCSDSVGTDFPDNILQDYKIVGLTMRNSGFVTLPYGLLSNLKDYVTHLDFSSNRIESVDFERLNSLPFASNLTVLKLHDNRIGVLPADAFSTMDSLLILTLQANQIEELPDNVFRGLTKLRTLHLYENQIHVVGAAAFAIMPKLEMLAIDLNAIQFLNEGTFSKENQTSLFAIPLEGNPFHCNCSLQWLKDYLVSIDYLVSSGAKCVYPKVAPFAEVDFCVSDKQETESE